MTAIPRVMISHKMFAYLIHTNIRNFRHCSGVFGVFFFLRGGGGGAITCFLMDFLILDTTGDKLCKTQLHHARSPDKLYIAYMYHTQN